MGFFDRLSKTANFLTGPARHLQPAQLRPVGGTGPAGESFRTGWWFDPLQPTTPLAPPSEGARRFEYVPGTNLIWTPRSGTGVSFGILNSLSTTLDILRVVIEHSKGSLRSMDSEIRPKRNPGETKKDFAIRTREDKNVAALREFWKFPDGENSFDSWINMFLEEMLVRDAANILIDRDRQGRVANARVIDGSTIVPLVDVRGFTPRPPDPAYYQTLYGAPAYLLTTHELVYAPFNRVNRGTENNLSLYGFPPVEQALMSINTLLRREMFDLAFYTDGNMPEALVGVPSDWTPKQIEQMQGWFDAMEAGKSNKRRRIRFIPTVAGGVGEKMNIAFPKINTASFDVKNLEWWANIIAQAFGISPQLFMRMMTRATANVSKEMSEQVGHFARRRHIENTINLVIQAPHLMGMANYEFSFQQREANSPSDQAAVDQIYVKAGIRTINEVREDRGWDPFAIPEANEPVVITTTGAIPVETEEEPDRPDSEPGAGRKPPKSVEQDQRPKAGNPKQPPVKKSDDKVGTLYLMRHGSTILNDEDRIRGWSSAPLTAKGRARARESAESLVGKGIALIFTSPLRRAKESAHIAQTVLGVPCSVDDDLAALNTGKLSGMKRDESGIAQYITHPEEEIPDGESLDQFRKRSVKAVDKHAKEAYKTGPQLLVVHNSVLMSLAEELSGEKPKPDQPDPVAPGGVMIYDENGLRSI